MNKLILTFILMVFHLAASMASIRSYISVFHCDDLNNTGGPSGKGKIVIDPLMPYQVFKWHDTNQPSYTRNNLDPGIYVLGYEIEPGCIQYEIIEILDLDVCDISLHMRQISNCGIRIWWEVTSNGKKLHPSSFQQVTWSKNGLPLSGNEYFIEVFSDHAGEYCVTVMNHGDCCGSAPLATCMLLTGTMEDCNVMPLNDSNVNALSMNRTMSQTGVKGLTIDTMELNHATNNVVIYPNPSHGELFAQVQSNMSGTLLCSWMSSLGTVLHHTAYQIKGGAMHQWQLSSEFVAPAGPVLLVFQFPNGEQKKQWVIFQN